MEERDKGDRKAVWMGPPTTFGMAGQWELGERARDSDYDGESERVRLGLSGQGDWA